MSAQPPDLGRRRSRRQAFKRGKSAEIAAAASLMVRGYRILAWRYRTHVGEIDLIAKRGRRLVFVEVKQRTSAADCEAAVTDETRQRVRRAADAWLARHAHFQDCEIWFDLVFVVPWRVPVHLRGAL